MSKQRYIVKEIQRLGRAAADAAIPTAIGGGTLLATPQHALDGPEHTAATATDQKLATTGHSGLLPPLSGDGADRLAGDGTWQPEVDATVFGAPAIVLGTAAANGSIDEVIRRDATIVAFDASLPTTQAFGDAAATGSVAKAAHRDHKHAMPSASAILSGLTQATARLLGRTSAGSGAIEEISVGTGLSLAAGVLSSSAVALDDLSDVTITTPVAADRLRYDGSVWRNTALIWKPVMSFDGTNWLVVTDGSGNAVMAEG